VQDRPGRLTRGGGPGTAVCQFAAGRQRPLRRSARLLAHRVRGRALPQPDGRVQLRRRRRHPRLRRAQAQRRPQAVHVALGRVHHRVRVPVGEEDPVAVPDAGGGRRRQVCVPRRGKDGRRHVGGPTARPRPLRRPDHAGVPLLRHLATQRCALAAAAHPVAEPEPRGRGEDGRVRPDVAREHLHEGQAVGGGG